MKIVLDNHNVMLYSVIHTHETLCFFIPKTYSQMKNKLLAGVHFSERKNLRLFKAKDVNYRLSHGRLTLAKIVTKRFYIHNNNVIQSWTPQSNHPACYLIKIFKRKTLLNKHYSGEASV